MAYRYEKNPISKESELVIDGFERGIADSPYGGLASIKNFNISYLPGAVYPNYKRLPASTSGGTGTFTCYTVNAASSTFYPQAEGGGSNVSCDGSITKTDTNTATLNDFRTVEATPIAYTGFYSSPFNPIWPIGYEWDYVGQVIEPQAFSYIAKYIQVDLRKVGSPTGNIVAKIYATTGLTGIPVGSVLATSNNFNVSSISTHMSTVFFTFSGANEITLSANNYYLFVLYYSGGTYSNYLYCDVKPATSYPGSFLWSLNGATFVSESGAMPFGIRGVKGGVANTNNQVVSLGAIENVYDELTRGFLHFDTSSLPNDVTITSATLSFVSTSKSNSFISSPDIHIASSTASLDNSLTVEDYLAVGTTSFGSISYSNIVSDGSTYNSITLNANGLSAISLTGVSKFSVQSSWDITNTDPGSIGYFNLNIYFSDNTTLKPQLTINYTSTSVTNTLIVKGVIQNKGGDAFTVTNTGGGLPTGLSAATVYYNLNTLNTIGDVFQVSATKGGSNITISSAGTGTQNIILIRPGLPVAWTQDPNTGRYFILCYDSASAVKIQVWEFDGVTNYWTLLSGNGQTSNGTDPTAGTHLGIGVWKKYLMVFHDDRVDICGNGTTINQTLWSNSWQTGLTLSPTPVNTLWGTIDYFYFANGIYVGSISENSGKTFAPGTADTFTFNKTALTLPAYDTVTYMTELKTNLCIASGNKLFFWDQISVSFNFPLFIKETIKKVLNIRNMLYVFAGTKGNIYTSNGYAIDFFKKIPDSFAGTTPDPQWTWGDVMSKHNKLYFGAALVNPTPGGIVGVFSMNLSGGSVISALGVTDGALNYENQNYAGSTVISGVLENTTCLINQSDTPYNNYLSAWYSNGYGGMDYNDSSLYNNYEPTIESDLIPVGTFLTPHTPQNIEFKLDTPLLAGDAISLYARSSLGENYKYIGTTSGSGLSANLGSLGLENMQWLQVKVTIACGSPSSFIRLREIRIR